MCLAPFPVALLGGLENAKNLQLGFRFPSEISYALKTSQIR